MIRTRKPPGFLDGISSVAVKARWCVTCGCSFECAYRAQVAYTSREGKVFICASVLNQHCTSMLLNFDHTMQCLETLWVELCASAHKELLLFVKMVLCFSHGNLSEEWGRKLPCILIFIIDSSECLQVTFLDPVWSYWYSFLYEACRCV